MNDPHQLSSNLTIRSICPFPTFYVVLSGSSFDHKGHWALAKLLAIGHTSHRHSPQALPSSSDRNPNLNPHLPLWEGVDARICSKRMCLLKIIFSGPMLKYRGCNISENMRRKCVQIALENVCIWALRWSAYWSPSWGQQPWRLTERWDMLTTKWNHLKRHFTTRSPTDVFAALSESWTNTSLLFSHREKYANMTMKRDEYRIPLTKKKQLEVAGLFKKSAITPVMGAAHMMIWTSFSFSSMLSFKFKTGSVSQRQIVSLSTLIMNKQWISQLASNLKGLKTPPPPTYLLSSSQHHPTTTQPKVLPRHRLRCPVPLRWAFANAQLGDINNVAIASNKLVADPVGKGWNITYRLIDV